MRNHVTGVEAPRAHQRISIRYPNQGQESMYGMYGVALYASVLPSATQWLGLHHHQAICRPASQEAVADAGAGVAASRTVLAAGPPHA